MWPSTPPNFCSVLSESKRIFLAHRLHFLGLSVLFLLPFSIFSHFYNQDHRDFESDLLEFLLRQWYSPTIIPCTTTTTTSAAANNNNTASILLPLIHHYVVTLFLSHLAVGSISFSAYHGFFDRPVKLISSILSLLRSFLPLLFTSLASLLIRYLIFLAFLIIYAHVIVLSTIGLGFKIDPSSPCLISCYMIVVELLLLLVVLVYLRVNWVLASIIAVVESSRGFEPLRRSTKLVKGMRGLTLSLMLFNCICTRFLWLGCSFMSNEFDGDIRSWKSWSFVLRMVVWTAGGIILMLQDLFANAVLYMYCKAAHGEVVKEIDEEFDGKYVSLPFDDGKVYHGVPVNTH